VAPQVLSLRGTENSISLTQRANCLELRAGGAPGRDADGNAIVATKTADGALGGHRIVRATGAATVGYVDTTDATNGDDVVGMTLQAADDGAPVTILTEGDHVEGGWSWTPLEAIYVTGLGMLTQTAPDSPDVFSLCVGFATSPTSIRLRIGVPVFI
jgi:hypothetical protein